MNRKNKGPSKQVRELMNFFKNRVNAEIDEAENDKF
jgi:hypothetical protein